MKITAHHLSEMFIFMVVALNVHHVHGCGTPVNITVLYRAVSKGAVCLDGSPPAYYHDVGFGEGASNWIVLLEGGGWCFEEASCLQRSKDHLGTSKVLPQQKIYWSGIISNNQTVNPDFYNWNRVHVRYCDGASFSGDVEHVDPKNNLHRRGARIFRAVVEDLRKKGLKMAKNAILAGHSAGGVATYLHCDNFREQIAEVPIVKCIADSGFFIHGKNLAWGSARAQSFATIAQFHGMNKTFHKSCTSKMDPYLCMFPEYFVGDIKTPIFLVNSAFDMNQLLYRIQPVDPDWQSCILGLNPCSPAQEKSIQDFATTLKEALPKCKCPSLGMFIDAGSVHDQITSDEFWAGCPTVNNKTIAKAVGDWFFNGSCSHDIDNTHDLPYLCSKMQKD